MVLLRYVMRFVPTDALNQTRKMPILNNHLLEDEDIIILNRDEDVLSIISVDPLF